VFYLCLTLEQSSVVCDSWLNISEHSVWIPVSILTRTFPCLHGTYQLVLFILLIVDTAHVQIFICCLQSRSVLVDGLTSVW